MKREGGDVARDVRHDARDYGIVSGHPPNFLPHIMNGRGAVAQAGLSMPRHVPGRADYDIWAAQKPPMLIDRPR